MPEEIKKTSIKQWAEDDRPREKLLKKGEKALSDAELVAILIASGNVNESAVEVARRILHTVDNNLVKLSRMSVGQLMKFKGIGEAKAINIVAAMELGRRRRFAETREQTQISSSKSAFEQFYHLFADLQYEQFWVLLLDQGHHIIKLVQIGEGGISGTAADPKKIFCYALENSASALIMCHNHPSGNIVPSNEDILLTKKIVSGGKLLDIQVLDHIIIGGDRYLSFVDENIMPEA